MNSLNLAKKSNICFVITQGHWGGAQRYVFDLAKNLKNDFNVTVAIGNSKHENDLKNKLENIKVVQLKHLRRSINPFHDLLALFEIKKFAKQNQIQIMHYNSSKATVIGALATKKICKSIATIHGWVSEEPLTSLRKTIYKKLEKISTKLLDAIIFADKHSLEIAKQNYKTPDNKIFYIPHQIKTPNFLSRQEARNKIQQITKHTITNNTKIIGTIANLYKTKNLNLLINAFAEPDYKDAICLIIGEGTERTNLEKQIKQKNLQNKIFLPGSITNAAQLLKGFDLFTQTSTKEGYPYTLLEAKAAQLPITATNVGGTKDILEKNTNSVLVDSPTTTEIFSQKIIQALQLNSQINPQTNPQINQSGSADFLQMIEKTKSLYRNLFS